jgi:acetyltransferase-like isoleucine patch superfamily enzyme
MVFGDKSKLNIAPNAVVENTLFNLSSGKIVIEDYVFCGHNVCINNGYV